MAKILLIDGEPQQRALLKAYLINEGHEVRTAERGNAAREMEEIFKPELVIDNIFETLIDPKLGLLGFPSRPA